MSERVNELLGLLRSHGLQPAFTLTNGVPTLRIPWPDESRDHLFFRHDGDNNEQTQYELLRAAVVELKLVEP